VPVPPPRKGFGWGPIISHAAFVAIVVVTYYGTWQSDGSGSPLGGWGGIVPPLLPLGLPWNVPYFFHWYWPGSRTEPMTSIYFVGPAVLNLLLHVAWRVRRRRQLTINDVTPEAVSRPDASLPHQP
jgi:hypothetical protein